MLTPAAASALLRASSMTRPMRTLVCTGSAVAAYRSARAIRSIGATAAGDAAAKGSSPRAWPSRALSLTVAVDSSRAKPPFV